MRKESYSNRFATALEGVDLEEPGVALDSTGIPSPFRESRGRSVVAPGRGTRREFLRSITDRRSRSPYWGRSRCRSKPRTTTTTMREASASHTRRTQRGASRLKAAGADSSRSTSRTSRPVPIPRASTRSRRSTVLSKESRARRSPHLLRLRTYRPRPPSRLPVPARARRVSRDTSLARGGTARPCGSAPRCPEQDRCSRSPRPRLAGGRDGRAWRCDSEGNPGRSPERLVRA